MHQAIDTSALASVIELRNAVRVARVGRRLVTPRQSRLIEALLGLWGSPRPDTIVSKVSTYLRSGLKYMATANAATPPYMPQYQMFSHASFTRFVPGAGGCVNEKANAPFRRTGSLASVSVLHTRRLIVARAVARSIAALHPRSGARRSALRSAHRHHRASTSKHGERWSAPGVGRPRRYDDT